MSSDCLERVGDPGQANVDTNNNQGEGLRADLEDWKEKLMVKRRALANLSARKEAEVEVTAEQNGTGEADRVWASQREIEAHKSVLETERRKVDLVKEINIVRNNFLICRRTRGGRSCRRVDNLISSLLDLVTVDDFQSQSCSTTSFVAATAAADVSHNNDEDSESKIIKVNKKVFVMIF
jgi:hypothetical protein